MTDLFDHLVGDVNVGLVRTYQRFIIVQHLIRILQSDWLRARYAQLRNFGVCTLQACDIHPGCCTLASDITMNITKKTFGTRTLEPVTQKIALRINAYAVASNVTSQKNTAYSV